MKNINKVFSKHNIELTTHQQNQFDEYFSYLVLKNKEFNLTSITEEQDVLVKHFMDSVLPQNLIPSNASVVDIGSGAGFPAIPLKIVRPDLKISMVDSLNKRVTFLNDVIEILKLSESSAIHSRAEDFSKNHREVFDVAVARAVAPLNTLVEYLLPLVKVGGQAIIYKSAKLDEELSSAHKAIKVLGAEITHIEKCQIEEEGFELMERNFLVLRKISPTPQKYPRGQNKPKLSPIK